MAACALTALYSNPTLATGFDTSVGRDEAHPKSSRMRRQQMDRRPPSDEHIATGAASVDSTLDLLVRARAGDASALDQLFSRYLGPLTRWARGRLPHWARQMRDTDDLVQESVIQTLRNIDHFEPERDGAFHAYLRRAVQNRLIDEVRRAGRTPQHTLGSDFPSAAPSPVEHVIGQEALQRYESAMSQLTPIEREAVIARIELGCSYAEIATAIGKNSDDAARMTVSRALLKLARLMA
jgi:RNA polymerase sigma factor (sigma-70 family)